ncbi:MAG: hypothetical protein N2C14_10875 [Planctomycetales bacterium]
MGENFIVWSARLAVLGYLAAVALRWSPSFAATKQRGLARRAWTVGCLLYLLHVGCAFHFAHAWSHQAAYLHTAQRSWEAVGWRFGGGLFFNYLFTATWFADALWWEVREESYLRRSAVLTCLVHGYLGFIVFNAAVVFESGFARWMGLAGLVLITAVLLFRLRMR